MNEPVGRLICVVMLIYGVGDVYGETWEQLVSWMMCILSKHYELQRMTMFIYEQRPNFGSASGRL